MLLHFILQQSLFWNIFFNLTIHLFTLHSILTPNTADSHTQNGRLLSPFSLLCFVVATATVSLRGWLLFSILHVFITDLCRGSIIGSTPGLPQLKDLQEDKHIQPLADPGNSGRHTRRKPGRVEGRISHTHACTHKHTQVDESELIKHCGFVPV